MNTRGAVGVIAGLLLLAGVIVGFMSTSVGSVSCGSAFASDSSAAQRADELAQFKQRIDNAGNPLLQEQQPASLVDQCSSAVGVRRAISWPLTGVGALGLLFLVLTMQWEPSKLSAVPAPEGAEQQS